MYIPDIYYLQSDHTSVHKNLGGQMQTAAHRVLPNSAEVGSSTEKPPTLLAHSGLNFVGRAGTVRQYSLTVGQCHHILQYCRYESAAGLKTTADCVSAGRLFNMLTGRCSFQRTVFLVVTPCARGGY